MLGVREGGHISGGTVVQKRGLVSRRCTGVHWLGSLEMQQEGLQCVTAWDVLCAQPQSVIKQWALVIVYLAVT